MSVTITLYDENKRVISSFVDPYNSLNFLHKIEGKYLMLHELTTDKARINYLKYKLLEAQKNKVLEEMQELYKPKYYKYFKKQFNILMFLVQSYKLRQDCTIEWSV